MHCFCMRNVINCWAVKMIYNPPALLSNLSVSVWDSPLISVAPVNPTSVSQLPVHPHASSLSTQQTSPAPSHSAPSSLWFPTVQSLTPKHRGSISTQIYDNSMIMSGLCTSFSISPCVSVFVSVCSLDLFVKSWWHSVQQQCLNKEELACKSQILSLKMNHCVCFVV